MAMIKLAVSNLTHTGDHSMTTMITQRADPNIRDAFPKATKNGSKLEMIKIMDLIGYNKGFG
jgi:hypothetical protein